MCALCLFIFGTVFGSFISVLVWRIKNNQKGILMWRSQCPNCKHTLWALDLIPIFSYIFLKWKCRYCKNKISIIYPILEFVTWLFFIFVAWFLLWNCDIESLLFNYKIVLYWLLASVFIVAIAFYDILFYEISFILVSILALLVFIPQFLWIIWDWKIALILAISWFLAFMWIIFFREKIRKIEWMWWWDAIWAALIWLMFPIVLQIMWMDMAYYGISFYIAILLWFVSAGIVWIFFILIWKWSKFAIPFLPFLFLWLILFVFFWKYLLEFVVN